MSMTGKLYLHVRNCELPRLSTARAFRVLALVFLSFLGMPAKLLAQTPVITAQPQPSSIRVNGGTLLTFTIGVSSATPVTYRWERTPVVQPQAWALAGTGSPFVTP